MKRTLFAMATGGLLSPSSPRAPRVPTRHLVSPSIMKWFGKGTAGGPMSRLVKSPIKSPRKLDVILSPRKLPHELRNGNSLHGIKRKASPPEDSTDSGKRKCTRGSVSAKKEPASPVSNGNHGRVLAPINNAASPTGQAKTAATRKLFMSTPTKTRNGGSGGELTFQSPTADLPNYVFNPQPRTPRASAKKNTDADKEKTPNWLTRMRLQKLAEKSTEGDKPSQSPGGSAASVNKSEAKQTPDGGSSHELGATPLTPSGQKTPRQVKRAISKSAKKRVSCPIFYQYILYYPVTPLNGQTHSLRLHVSPLMQC